MNGNGYTEEEVKEITIMVVSRCHNVSRHTIFPNTVLGEKWDIIFMILGEKLGLTLLNYRHKKPSEMTVKETAERFWNCLTTGEPI